MADHEPPTPNVRRIVPRRQVMAGDPIAELRARFIAALFCTSGNHVSDNAYAYNGSQYCPEHRPAPAPQDPLEPGLCEWSTPHYSPATRMLPGITRPIVRGPRRVCQMHLAALLTDFWRRGDYGRRHGS